MREITGVQGVANAIELRDGSLLMAHAGNPLTRIAKDSDKRTVLTTGLRYPLGLALSGPDHIYVSEVDAGTITRIHATTGAKQVIASGLKLPQTVAVDGDGNLLTVELSERRLVRIDPRDGRATTVATNLPVGLFGTGADRLSVGVSVGPSGAIYVASDIENSIYKLTK